jgi:hypothetical protein
VKQWLLDAGSEGWSGYSLGDEVGGAMKYVVGSLFVEESMMADAMTIHEVWLTARST